jgi:hypothetical protein
MPDDDDIPIPAFIRNMLEPYRNIMGTSDDYKPKRRLERTLLEAEFRPTIEHLQAIGAVAFAWSVLERVLGILLARLALAPEYPTLALTKQLSAVDQIRVLRTLIPLWRERYLGALANDALIEDIAKFPAQLEKLKDERNVIVHTVWIKKNSETVSAMRAKPVTEASSAINPPVDKTISQMNQLAIDIQSLADRIFIFSQLLPAVDEVQHAQSLAQAVQTLHREILGEHQSPPQSSEE